MSTYSPEVILSHLARGLIELERMTDAPGPTGLPYPRSLHIAWNRLGRLMLRQGLPIPSSLPSLLDQCGQPLPWQGLALPQGTYLPGDRLLADRRVTDACIEIAEMGDDLEHDESLMKRVLEFCRLQGPELQPSYERFRSFVIEELVIPSIKLLDAYQEFPQVMGDFLKQAYEEVPASCLCDGKVYVCKHCGYTVTWQGDEPRCAWQQCPGDRDPNSTVAVPYSREQLVRLRPGLYRYVAIPGRAELAFYRQVKQLGLPVDLYPEFDRWDLRVHMPSGETWALDFKDWGRPYWLAEELKGKRCDPEDARAIIVIPDRRVKEFPGYLNVLINCVGEECGLEFRTVSGLIEEIKQRIGGV